MKKIGKLGLCALLIFGLAVSTAPAAQDKEARDVTQDERSSAIKELTIRNSGFRSKSTIVIRYRDEDKKIVEVIENGKKLPPSEFSRYESVIREVLELPQIDRLLPEIDRAKRRAESPRISEESKIREMLELRRRMEGLESDVARRYRDFNELQLMTTLNSLTQKISESSELTREEKITQLKEVIEKIQALEVARKLGERRRRLVEFGTANAVRKLIEEISESAEISQEEKIKEIQKLLQQVRETELSREEGRRGDLIEIEATNALRKMLQEIAEKKNLSDEERAKQFERVLEEAKNMESENMKRVIGIEKFKFDLHQLLKNEGLLPEGEARFVLKRNECSIDGKKLPREIHERILKLCEESIGKKFEKDTKIVLQLNQNRE